MSLESAQSQQVANAQKEDQAKRHLVSETEMREFVRNHTNKNWQEVTGMINYYTGFLTPYRKALLTYTGLDGMAIEISASVGGSFIAGVDFTPVGASIFFPFQTGVPDGTSPHPVDDAPHYFLFSSVGVDLGFSGGVEGGADLQVVFADNWETPADITVDSWGGCIIAVDVEAGIAIGGGAELSGTLYFTSISPSSTPPFGALSNVIPDSGWHGAGLGASIGGGGEVELSIGITLTSTINQWLEKLFGRPDVRRAMQNPTEIPEAGELHYQPPSDPLSQFIDWLADSSSGVGEAMQR